MQFNFDRSVEVFYKRQKQLLDFYSIWPQQVRWKRVLHDLNFWHLMSFWILLFNLALILYIVLNINDMNEVVKSCFLLATGLGYIGKTVSLKLNNEAFLQLFANLHDAAFRPKGIEEQRVFLLARKLSGTVRNSYGTLSMVALAMMLLAQYLIDSSELPLATYDPFNGPPGSFWFWFMYMYQCVALSMGCFMNICYDSLCCSLFIFASCQLDLLALRLQQIGRNSDVAPATAHQMELQLKNCIIFYMKIVQLATDIEALVYKPISLQIFSSVLVLTANFYALSQLSDEILMFLNIFIYQNCMLIQIFILCYFAGEITQRSLGLSHELYKSNWVGSQRSNRRLLLMLMQRLDSAIRIRTINANQAFDLALFSSVSLAAVLCTVVG